MIQYGPDFERLQTCSHMHMHMHLHNLLRMYWIIPPFFIPVKEGKRQRKEAKLIKQLDKQRQQEAAEREKLEEQQDKNGKAIVLSCASVCSSPRDPAKRQVWCFFASRSGRPYTVSVALPGSVLDNAQSPELRTYLAGQIARASVVFAVDEIVVFDEQGEQVK